MTKRKISVLIAAGLVSALLAGCGAAGTTGAEVTKTAAGTGTEDTSESAAESGAENASGSAAETGAETGGETKPESDAKPGSEPGSQTSDLPYQFARMYGIIQSEYPVYELDAPVDLEFPEKEMTVSVTSALHQDKELLVSMVLMDHTEVERIPADGEVPDDAVCYTLSDGSRIDAAKYQAELWDSGEGLFLTGPGIPKEGLKPVESLYLSFDMAYFEEYGEKRYVIEARFDLPSAPEGGAGERLSGYGLSLLDFEKPVEFALKKVPEYGSLEDLAKKEQGGIDTHEDISIITMGEKVEEGILVSWYLYSGEGEKAIVIGYQPPPQENALPTISDGEQEYPILKTTANPYWDNLGHYRLSDMRAFGRRTRCMFAVPEEAKDNALQMNIPGVTFLNSEESEPVTVTVPEDQEELNLDIPWEDGSVRILKATRMKEPQRVGTENGQGGASAVELPVMHIDVEAVHEHRDLALKGLLCERTSRMYGWQRVPYEFDEKWNLSGFKVFFVEGDEEITLKFFRPAFFWNQPYVMDLKL